MATGQHQASQGLLLFHLNERQTFGIGTLKVKEIVPFQPLTAIPQSHPVVLGASYIRGETIPVIDLAAAIGYRPPAKDTLQECFVIVTDCQRQRVGFLVRKIDRIIDYSWRNISPPPKGAGNNIYSTGVISHGEELVQLLDIEMVLSHIFPVAEDELHAHITASEQGLLRSHPILLVDDSSVARRQLAEALNFVNVPFDVSSDGSEALDMMEKAAARDEPYDILVSDIEMPGLDGYELAFEIRNNPKLASMYLILHTSLSSEISVDRAHQVGANEALTKFDAAELIHAMLRGAEHVEKGDVVPGVASRLQV
ncbi:MAG: chemotaxis protein CheW [Oceanospirillaceae bacterium]|nr:chemotaxis protein CheW [Oceanospirillaceae bacterium]MBT11080.1 chemotaxis protein CheW [Oceanospirillaceae bacterium]|tara:strand:+ start:24408 stop:25340 length:933 start_codon:yes stop_codon:yes gene_type:complete